jgi:hypothetical protein
MVGQFIAGLVEYNLIADTIGYNLQIKQQQRKSLLPDRCCPICLTVTTQRQSGTMSSVKPAVDPKSSKTECVDWALATCRTRLGRPISGLW